jgi:hypothetical protein
LKENVILGRLIPAGTGFTSYNSLQLKTKQSAVDPDSVFVGQADEVKVTELAALLGTAAPRTQETAGSPGA